MVMAWIPGWPVLGANKVSAEQRAGQLRRKYKAPADTAVYPAFLAAAGWHTGCSILHHIKATVFGIIYLFPVLQLLHCREG